MNGLRLTFLCTALTLSHAIPAATPSPGPAHPQDAVLRDLGREWLERFQGIGLSIGIYDDGQRYFYNFGSTQLDGNRAPTKDTIYEIGSISKTMAGQLLARAIVEDRAALSDEIERYLGEPYPNLAQDGEKIRLIHLANMTSQLIDNIPDLTQVRLVPGELIEATRMKIFEGYTKAEFLQQLHRVVPRTKLDEALATVARLCTERGLRVGNVFHAGDGNLHPNISFDRRDPELSERVQAASREIMKVCVAAGGSITGEHGVGSDKIDYMPLIFDAETLGAMQAVRRVFDPAELANPGKVVPVRACREWAGTPAARARQEVA